MLARLPLTCEALERAIPIASGWMKSKRGLNRQSSLVFADCVFPRQKVALSVHHRADVMSGASVCVFE